MKTFSTSYMPESRRIIAVTGHYGSGKTEFAVSLALLLAAEKALPWKKLAVVDLDIANPYFRSRERGALLEKAGVKVYGSAYHTEITAELPALDAAIRAPLEDEDCCVIVDLGGNDAGAKVIHQFRKYFERGENELLCVVNASRFETRTVRAALEHLEAIEAATGMTVNGIVNNCHLIMETTASDIERGHALCAELCRETGKALWCDCYPAPLVRPEDISPECARLMPLGMYMRESWLDK